MHMKLCMTLVTRVSAFGVLFTNIKQPLNLRPYCVSPTDNIEYH